MAQGRNPALSKSKIRPGQLLVSDVTSETLWCDGESRLELNETPVSTIFDENSYDAFSKGRANKNAMALADLLGLSRSEEQGWRDRHDQYGWLAELRLPDDSNVHCRWIHISSKFPEYIMGAFQGLSDWTQGADVKFEALRSITKCMYEEERFSKHGKTFAPFVQPLVPVDSVTLGKDTGLPIFISTPFLDWSLDPRKPIPALRFQIDDREHSLFSKHFTHPLRSLLQYRYRLEDTTEREHSQVFTKHRPWYSDREVDLKVRRWFGHHPSSLVVDELWVLVIDSKHIVTFASNQTWKSRWPPLQVSSRIEEVSFRGIRDMCRAFGGVQEYNALTHAVTCVHGAVGLMHRGFWTDMPLSCTDRYGDYLSHLQYRIYRQPSTKLVMELLQVQDELNIVLGITNAQLDLIRQFGDMVSGMHPRPSSRSSRRVSTREQVTSALQTHNGAHMSHHQFSLSDPESPPPRPINLSFGETGFATTVPPLKSWLMGSPDEPDVHVFFLTGKSITSLERKLRREFDDLTELRNNANELITRTVQLVNMRMEDHGQAILVFTVVTIIFLPLSFVASIFSMNVSELRDSTLGISYFWAAGLGLTAFVLITTTVLAFYGGSIRDWFRDWTASHDSWVPVRKSKDRSTRDIALGRGPFNPVSGWRW